MVFAHAQHPSEGAESLPAGGPRGESAYPPEHLGDKGELRPGGEQKPACRVVRLKRRPEFLATAASGKRWVAPAFVLQVASRADQPSLSGEAGLGFTATRRIGNAVARNRAKRRLREAARLLLPEAAMASCNYVLVARSAVLTCPFQALLDDLSQAFRRVLTAKPRPPGPSRPRSRQRRKDSPSAAMS